MSKEIKIIGLLTSGGDAPGMNAAIRAVTRAALAKGMRVMGIRRGFNGLIHGDIVELDLRSVSDIIHRGGTLLYTARCPEFKTEEGMKKAVDICKQFGIDGVVVIGGDGSFRGAADLSARGVISVGIPGTIDNDIAASEYTIGFDTALDTIMKMVDRIRDTSQSHDRCSVVEVMGRGTGWLALNSGIAVGATLILVPEIAFDFEKDIIYRMKKTLQTGKKHFIIIAAEGIGNAEEFAERIEAETGIQSRASVLGYVQRGGSPTVKDRIIASQMGHYAVELLFRGIGNRVVVMKDNKIIDYDIFEAAKMIKPFDLELYNIANEINI